MPEYIRIIETNVVLNHISTLRHKRLKKERNGDGIKRDLKCQKQEK